ncbi:ESPR-type extended signal peptide-containing protein, partial [Salmonella enterica subsp. enterica]
IESLGAWVAASELTKARGKPNKSAVALAVGAMLLATPFAAQAQYSAGGGTAGQAGSIAVGTNASATTDLNAIAIGATAIARGTSAISIGAL